MTITIPDTLAEQARLDEKSALKELAIGLFAQQRLSASRARRLCGANFFEFESWLRERNIPVHVLTEEVWEEDLKTLREAGLL